MESIKLFRLRYDPRLKHHCFQNRLLCKFYYFLSFVLRSSVLVKNSGRLYLIQEPASTTLHLQFEITSVSSWQHLPRAGNKLRLILEFCALYVTDATCRDKTANLKHAYRARCLPSHVVASCTVNMRLTAFLVT